MIVLVSVTSYDIEACVGLHYDYTPICMSFFTSPAIILQLK
jgi:hypothetical protein